MSSVNLKNFKSSKFKKETSVRNRLVSLTGPAFYLSSLSLVTFSSYFVFDVLFPRKTIVQSNPPFSPPLFVDNYKNPPYSPLYSPPIKSSCENSCEIWFFESNTLSVYNGVNDSICSDGGSGSILEYDCGFGNDCLDCGERLPIPPASPLLPPLQPQSPNFPPKNPQLYPNLPPIVSSTPFQPGTTVSNVIKSTFSHKLNGQICDTFLSSRIRSDTIDQINLLLKTNKYIYISDYYNITTSCTASRRRVLESSSEKIYTTTVELYASKIKSQSFSEEQKVSQLKVLFGLKSKEISESVSRILGIEYVDVTEPEVTLSSVDYFPPFLPMPPYPPSIPKYENFLCLNTCTKPFTNVFEGNGVCQDGGFYSSSAECFYGYDCKDCGPRVDYEIFWKNISGNCVKFNEINSDNGNFNCVRNSYDTNKDSYKLNDKCVIRAMKDLDVKVLKFSGNGASKVYDSVELFYCNDYIKVNGIKKCLRYQFENSAFKIKKGDLLEWITDGEKSSSYGDKIVVQDGTGFEFCSKLSPVVDNYQSPTAISSFLLTTNEWSVYENIDNSCFTKNGCVYVKKNDNVLNYNKSGVYSYSITKKESLSIPFNLQICDKSYEVSKYLDSKASCNLLQEKNSQYSYKELDTSNRKLGICYVNSTSLEIVFDNTYESSVDKLYNIPTLCQTYNVHCLCSTFACSIEVKSMFIVNKTANEILELKENAVKYKNDTFSMSPGNRLSLFTQNTEYGVCVNEKLEAPVSPPPPILPQTSTCKDTFCIPNGVSILYSCKDLLQHDIYKYCENSCEICKPDCCIESPPSIPPLSPSPPPLSVAGISKEGIYQLENGFTCDSSELPTTVSPDLTLQKCLWNLQFSSDTPKIVVYFYGFCYVFETCMSKILKPGAESYYMKLDTTLYNNYYISTQYSIYNSYCSKYDHNSLEKFNTKESGCTF